ncbi:MAG: glycerol-3-phosphate acyltransferase, partial [Clostridia bacterium]|nr:glycerol-3-phosphate acyltransferase [Clostridia bacterium]
MTFSQIWNNGFLSNIVFPSQGSLIAVTLVSGLAVSVLSYLLGSINPAIIVSKKFYGDDIRTHGSGNAGMTNVMRTYGKLMAIITFLGDFLYAVVASLLGSAFLGVFGAFMAGFFCFLGLLY